MNKQKILNELDKMKDRINELEQELNKTEEEWIPEYNEKYWYYYKDGEIIDFSFWSNYSIHNIRLKNKVIFKTKAEAQRYADYQKAKEAYSYEFSKKEWKNSNILKYYFYLNTEYTSIEISWTINARYVNFLYFKTKDQAQEFIDKYKDEILEFEFGIKE